MYISYYTNKYINVQFNYIFVYIANRILIPCIDMHKHSYPSFLYHKIPLLIYISLNTYKTAIYIILLIFLLILIFIFIFLVSSTYYIILLPTHKNRTHIQLTNMSQIRAQAYQQKQQYDGILSDKGRFRISPVKTRQPILTRKSLKPFSSSIIQQKKPIPTKQDILKINSKIQLIKSKVMKSGITRSDSKKTLQSQYINNGQQLNDSVDMDSQDQGQREKGTTAHMIRSKYEDRPATIFFHYPKCCGSQTMYADRVYVLEKANLKYKIAGSEYKCIVNSLEFNGFVKTQSNTDWNIFFDIIGINQKALQTMNKYQKMNHFPGCWQLGRKDHMWKNLNKQRRANPQAYNFVPTTYIFPYDFDRFQMIRQNADKNTLWIMKPTNSACGRGIKMINKQSNIKNKKDILVSEYIANPHLINNFKYDLRIYILVTSYDPLRIYMFKEGLTRFATYQYTNKVKDISKRFIHLTNFSVNKHSKKFVKNSKAQKDGQGSKWSITALKKWYEQNGIDTKQLFNNIKDVIIKTCISAQPVMLDIHSKTQQKRNCGFQLYGFDILIDNKLKPWLMQVNVCPSLSSSSPMDRRIKHTLLTDTLNIIGLQYISQKALQKDKKKDKLKLLQRQDKKYFSKNINNLQNLTYNNCIQILSPQDWQMLFQSCEQLDRCGNYQRIFPLKSNVDTYKNLFEFNRYNNNVLWKYIKSQADFLERLYA